MSISNAAALPQSVPEPSPTHRDNLALRIYCYSFVAMVLFLIFAGAMVTSNNAGLAVPDWPTTFGENMFTFHPSKWVGGIFYEHGHRLLASGVGALTIMLTAWLAIAERRAWVRKLGYAALALVIVQGLLGGLTVLLKLPAWTSSLHGLLGQTFLVLSVMIAYSQSYELRHRTGAQQLSYGSESNFRLAVFGIALLYIQLLLGAFVRHTESGLAIPDFPTMGFSWYPRFDSAFLEVINEMRSGMLLPAVEMHQILLHFAHRVVGVVLLAAVPWISISILRTHSSSPGSRRTARLALLVCLLQFSLGALTVLSGRHPTVTSLHVLGGASLLALMTLMALQIFPMPYRGKLPAA